MKTGIRVMIVLAAVFLATTGCSSLIEVNKRRMSTEEIVAMSDAGVGVDVIKRQIDATDSRFTLTSDEVVALKKAGVDDTVIEHMITTSERPERFDHEYYDPFFPGSLAYRYDPYQRWYPVRYHAYPLPYAAYRQEGRIGRFYDYRPVYPNTYPHTYESWEWYLNRPTPDNER